MVNLNKKISIIRKKLERFENNKDKLEYLERLVKKIKSQKLIEEIKKLMKEFESLESEVEGFNNFNLRESFNNIRDFSVKEFEDLKYVKNETSERPRLESSLDDVEKKEDRQIIYDTRQTVFYDSSSSFSSSPRLEQIRETLGRKRLLGGWSDKQQEMFARDEIHKMLGDSDPWVIDRYINELKEEETFKKYKGELPSLSINEMLKEEKDLIKYKPRRLDVK